MRKTFDMIDEIANRENKEVCLPDVVVFLCQPPWDVNSKKRIDDAIRVLLDCLTVQVFTQG